MRWGEARADSTGHKHFSWASNAFWVLCPLLCLVVASTHGARAALRFPQVIPHTHGATVHHPLDRR